MSNLVTDRKGEWDYVSSPWLSAPDYVYNFVFELKFQQNMSRVIVKYPDYAL